jgi:hypothetical protein
VETELETAESGETGKVLVCFPFLFADSFRRVMAILDTPIMCRMASVNRANSGLSGGGFIRQSYRNTFTILPQVQPGENQNATL